MYTIILLVEQIETYIHLEQPFELLHNTWKFGGSVLGTEVAGGAQTEQM